MLRNRASKGTVIYDETEKPVQRFSRRAVGEYSIVVPIKVQYTWQLIEKLHHC